MAMSEIRGQGGVFWSLDFLVAKAAEVACTRHSLTPSSTSCTSKTSNYPASVSWVPKMLGIAVTAFKSSRNATVARVGSSNQSQGASGAQRTYCGPSRHGDGSVRRPWKKFAIIGGSILVRS